MTQKDKELLLRDLCTRLPYKVIVEIISYGQEDLRPWFGELSLKDLECFMLDVAYKSMKPYLRPMSSMTEDEKDFIRNKYFYEDWDSWNDLLYYHYNLISVKEIPEFMEWIYTHHFDFLNLIEKGLALEASTNMYNN